MEEDKPQDGTKPLTAYVPVELAERVERSAKTHKRSISAEVWDLIEKALQMEEERRAS